MTCTCTECIKMREQEEESKRLINEEMKTKFTPGPWKMDANSVQTAINTKDNEKHIAMINYNQVYMTENEHYANAKLIANAPELYNVLQEALDEKLAYEAGERVYGKWIEKAKVVLAKARGES